MPREGESGALFEAIICKKKRSFSGLEEFPDLSGQVEESPRREIFYFDAGGNLNALRYDDWKLHFTLMEGAINEAYRKTPSWPILFNLRADPFEVSHESALYIRWFADQMWTFVPAQTIAAEFLSTFKEFPPVAGSSLGIDKVVQSLTAHPGAQ